MDRKAQRCQKAEQRQKLATLHKPLQARLGKVESEMASCAPSYRPLDALIANADLYSDARRAEHQQVMAEHGELGKHMNALEEDWLEIQASLEEVTQDVAG